MAGTITKKQLALWLKAKTIESSSGCWEWTGGMHGVGYGCVPNRYHASRYAHRAMYEAVCSEIPPKMQIMHSCDNRKCINPEHLSIGTHLENIKDMQAKGRQRGGSMRGEKNPANKFSDSVVLAIRQRASDGIAKRMIEIEFGVSESQYYRIVKNQVRVQK